MDETFLICLPFAGSGASFFKRWRSRTPERLSVVPVQLPGREERLAESAYTVASLAAAESLDQITRHPGVMDGRVALFGHSMGAVLAFELAHLLEAGGKPLTGLFVSGSAGPLQTRENRASGLSDEEFLAQVNRLAGYSHPALDHPEMRELLLPMLRADVAMHEDYRPASSRPLSCPVTVLRGLDDELVSAADARQWKSFTTGSFSSVELPGGHMYLSDDDRALLNFLITAL